MNMISLSDGKQYMIVHAFNEARVIIDYDGLFVLVDNDPQTGWELSGEPANQDEKPVLATLTASMKDKSKVIVVKD